VLILHVIVGIDMYLTYKMMSKMAAIKLESISFHFVGARDNIASTKSVF
jgi:hypothetical protein